MSITAPFFQKLKFLKLSAFTIYPIIILLFIPALLIFNTYWNIRSFNRDANFIVRHQAVSISDTLKPLITSESNPEDLGILLTDLVSSNEDILSITVFKKSQDEIKVYAQSKGANDNLSYDALNKIAIGIGEPLAGLTYNPNLGRNTWDVAVPLSLKDSEPFILTFQLDTKSVNEILQRTSRDSFIILSILIVVTLILMLNYFYFYLKALKTKQLEELDRLKDEFISMAAHELRAPITGITGYLELLKSKILTQESASIKSELDILADLTKDLNSLVEELLDVSRIEQGRIKIEIVEVQVNEVIDKVVTVMSPLSQEKGLNILVKKSEIPIVKSDPGRIRQILTNIISNSIKYSLKGEITVEAVVEGKFVKLTVKDTGIGIPPEETDKLFTKFHRVQDKQTRDVRGTGLGLWITKQLVELLGGRINVESIYGTGTSVFFIIPLSI